VQFLSLRSTCHALNDYFILPYISLCCFILHHITLPSKPYLSLHAFKTCTISSSHAILELIWAYAISSLHAVLELACYHYMQFLSLWHICHALITCRSGACMAYAISPLHAISKCNFGAYNTYAMPPTIALYCFVLLCIILHYFVLLCIWLHSEPYRYYGPYTLWPLRHTLCHHCMEFWSLGEHMPYPLYMQFWGLQGTCHAIIVCSV
jgi:hypothetical protein